MNLLKKAEELNLSVPKFEPFQHVNVSLSMDALAKDFQSPEMGGGRMKNGLV
jgi:hypothetical protein